MLSVVLRDALQVLLRRLAALEVVESNAIPHRIRLLARPAPPPQVPPLRPRLHALIRRAASPRRRGNVSHSACFSFPPTPQRLTAALKVQQRDAQPALARPRADRLRRRRRQLVYIGAQRRQDVWSLQLGDTITITRVSRTP
jgi:hypothetical protein